MSRTTSKNPFITDRTTIKDATPSEIPAMEMPVMTEMSETFRRLDRYRRAMKREKEILVGSVGSVGWFYLLRISGSKVTADSATK